MWFDIVKVNLLETLQGDADAKGIDIQESNKCKERIIRFERNLYREFDYGAWYNPQGMKPKVPEKVYCWMVEQLDKFFNANFIKAGKRGREINSLEEDFNSTPDRYEIQLFSAQQKAEYDETLFSSLYNGTPFVFKLFQGSSADKPLIDVGFYVFSGVKNAGKRYNDIKSCWERA